MVTRLIVFLAIVLSIVAGVHLYFWARLVRDTGLPFPYRTWASGALIALAIVLPLPFFAIRALPPAWSRLVVWPGFVWMGLMFLLLSALVVTDLIRLFVFFGAKLGAADLSDPGRRTFIARLLGLAAGAAAGLSGGLALSKGLGRAAVKEVEVKLRRLPRASHGTTIVQLTDVHVGPTIGRAFVEDLVRRTNELEPDLIAITGDLVDGKVETLWEAVSPLKDLKARHGVYFVTGNHEFFSGVGPWMEALGRLGIRVLRNERVSIGGAGGFDLAGVHDYNGGRLEASHAPDLGRALAGRDPGREVVLLAHQPRAVHEAAERDIGLVLSGHTHGGQIWPFSYLVRLQQPYVQGLHKHGDSATQIYVSPGTGYWGPPMRLRTQAEITRVRLLSGDA